MLAQRRTMDGGRDASSGERRGAVAEAFAGRFGRAPEGIAEAPGRVNLIGEHTDYNEGFVLPVAIDRTVLVAFTRRTDREVRACSLDFEQEDAFLLDDIRCRESDVWGNYLRGVAAVLQAAGHDLTGLDLAVEGDVPIGAGLSSSAALEVAVLGAFRAACGLTIEPRDAALLAQRAENEFVGVACGIMDQMAAVLGRRDHALLIDCRSLDAEPIALNLARHGLRIVVADTGVRRRLSESAYNQRREECERALELLGDLTPYQKPRSLRDITPEYLEAMGGGLPEPLLGRARHVVRENERVFKSVEALEKGDLAAFGGMLYASHESLAEDYEVSSAELDLMVELARSVEGVVGARMTGAGFGGCTVNLVYEEVVEGFRREVVEAYRRQTGLPAEMYVCEAVDGLRVIPGADV